MVAISASLLEAQCQWDRLQKWPQVSTHPSIHILLPCDSATLPIKRWNPFLQYLNQILTMWSDLGNEALANMTQERHEKVISDGARDKIIVNKHSLSG